jgi:hypothetical protein
MSYNYYYKNLDSSLLTVDYQLRFLALATCFVCTMACRIRKIEFVWYFRSNIVQEYYSVAAALALLAYYYLHVYKASYILQYRFCKIVFHCCCDVLNLA